MNEALARLGIVFMRAIARLPLAWVRSIGAVLGWLLYLFAVSRRRVVDTNLRLCFPGQGVARRGALVRSAFVHFAQAWIDRSWLWHGDPGKTLDRLRVTGAVDELAGTDPVILFAPHFVGLDAGWTALTQQLDRSFATIYTPQRNKVVDRWSQQGRSRFGRSRIFERRAGTRAIVSMVRSGQALYLLPDMNFGPQESVFVPFYGVPAATLTSLSRFSKLGRAKVVPVLTRMTPEGYAVEILPAWRDFPGADPVADAALMNQRLEHYIDAMPDQYYWVHRRFKSRPPGAAPVY